MEIIGFIGLGAMGGSMAGNLVKAGYTVHGFDTSKDRLDAFGATGGHPIASVPDVVRKADIVFTSLPSSEVLVSVADDMLLPNARKGQVFVDVGTVSPPQARRLSSAFGEKGAVFLDVPVTGGTGGAAAGTLRLFCGGEEAAFEAIKPILGVIGDPEYIAYCGPSGSGQVIKGVNQLAMGLVNAAFLESISFGVNAGVSLETIKNLVGGAEGWRAILTGMCKKIESGNGDHVGIKYGQYKYFLEEADSQGFSLPISGALKEFLAGAPEVIKEANRMSPSLWQELTKEH